jgi:hypothetical protein
VELEATGVPPRRQKEDRGASFGWHIQVQEAMVKSQSEPRLGLAMGTPAVKREAEEDCAR